MNTLQQTATAVKGESDAKSRTETATFISMTEAHRRRSERMEAARQATAAFLGYDDGEMIFA